MKNHEYYTEKLTKILQEEAQKDNLDELFARYDNALTIAVDGDDEEEITELQNILGSLKYIIVQRYMKNKGWYINNDETYPKWTKDI